MKLLFILITSVITVRADAASYQGICKYYGGKIEQGKYHMSCHGGRAMQTPQIANALAQACKRHRTEGFRRECFEAFSYAPRNGTHDCHFNYCHYGKKANKKESATPQPHPKHNLGV